jgi:homoserine kinase type II
MTNVVYDLWYEREYEHREDTELHIGIYSSQAEALAAIERLRDKTGFCDYPEGFNIYPITLNRDGWTSGFVSILESEMIEQGFAPSKPNVLRDLPPRRPRE